MDNIFEQHIFWALFESSAQATSFFEGIFDCSKKLCHFFEQLFDFRFSLLSAFLSGPNSVKQVIRYFRWTKIIGYALAFWLHKIDIERPFNGRIVDILRYIHSRKNVKKNSTNRNTRLKTARRQYFIRICRRYCQIKAKEEGEGRWVSTTFWTMLKKLHYCCGRASMISECCDSGPLEIMEQRL